MNETWYDEEEDILGIQVGNGKYWKSVEVARNVVLDLSNDGKIIGVEIFQAKKHFKDDAPLIVANASNKTRR